MTDKRRQMWSPWRSEHMERFKALHSPSEDLAGLFEGIGNAQDDEKHLVVWRGVSVFVLMNLFPYNNGHMMIAPYRRVASYMELTTEERHELADVLAKCQQWLDEVLRPEGYNIGMNLGKAAGAGIPGHLHVHVVPRWSGDTNFMPTVADIKVVPQAIEETYSKLRAVADRDHDQ